MVVYETLFKFIGCFNAHSSVYFICIVMFISCNKHVDSLHYLSGFGLLPASVSVFWYTVFKFQVSRNIWPTMRISYLDLMLDILDASIGLQGIYADNILLASVKNMTY